MTFVDPMRQGALDSLLAVLRSCRVVSSSFLFSVRGRAFESRFSSACLLCGNDLA